MQTWSKVVMKESSSHDHLSNTCVQKSFAKLLSGLAIVPLSTKNSNKKVWHIIKSYIAIYIRLQFNIKIKPGPINNDS